MSEYPAGATWLAKNKYGDKFRIALAKRSEYYSVTSSKTHERSQVEQWVWTFQYADSNLLMKYGYAGSYQTCRRQINQMDVLLSKGIRFKRSL